MKARHHIFVTHDQLANAAAGTVCQLSALAIAKRGRFTVALSGGSLPKLLCPPLVTEPLYSQVDWPSWHVFWADERCVPLTSPDSNYRLAREYLFDHVDIPPAQIYALDDSLAPAAAATAYQETLAQVFQPASDLPRFDLILLGMGEDGHTASLFPDHPLLDETERWVAPIFDSPKPPPERITLTLPVINNARQVIFLTAGPGKAEALSQITKHTNRLPAGMVQPANGELHWFVDNAAAAGLHV
jgi:6-phosphogluconolactonase